MKENVQIREKDNIWWDGVSGEFLIIFWINLLARKSKDFKIFIFVFFLLALTFDSCAFM